MSLVLEVTDEGLDEVTEAFLTEWGFDMVRVGRGEEEDDDGSGFTAGFCGIASLDLAVSSVLAEVGGVGFEFCDLEALSDDTFGVLSLGGFGEGVVEVVGFAHGFSFLG